MLTSSGGATNFNDVDVVESVGIGADDPRHKAELSFTPSEVFGKALVQPFQRADVLRRFTDPALCSGTQVVIGVEIRSAAVHLLLVRPELDEQGQGGQLDLFRRFHAPPVLQDVLAQLQVQQVLAIGAPVAKPIKINGFSHEHRPLASLNVNSMTS